MVLLLTSLVGGGAMFVGLATIDRVPDGLTISLVFGGILVGLAAAVLAATTIRCPSCKTRWVWKSWRTQSVGNWLYYLMSHRACHECGYPDTPRSDSAIHTS